MTLQGGGTVELLSSGDFIATISGDSTGALNPGTLNNIDNIIEGTGNLGDGTSDLTLNNQGTIHANVSGTYLSLLTGGNAITNSGTLVATNGGELSVQSPVDNSGTIEVQGGTLQFDYDVSNSGAGNALIEGGVVDFAASSNVDEITFNNGVSGTNYGELVLGAPSGYTATISGFAGTAPNLTNSDGIELAGTWTVASETPSGGNLVLELKDGSEVATLTFDDFSGTLNIANSDGNTIITDPPGTSANALMPSSATANGTNGSITYADANTPNPQTANFAPEGSTHVGTFTLDPVGGSNGSPAFVSGFHLDNDQINIAPEGTMALSYAANVGDVQNPALTMNETASVSVGGPGNDTFIFGPKIGADTIDNFYPQRHEPGRPLRRRTNAPALGVAHHHRPAWRRRDRSQPQRQHSAAGHEHDAIAGTPAQSRSPALTRIRSADE